METISKVREELSLEDVGHHKLAADWLDLTLNTELLRLRNCKPEDLAQLQARIQMLEMYIKAPVRLVEEERKRRAGVYHKESPDGR